MGKRILNKNNCIFICPALSGKISKTQTNHHFNDGNGVALTQNTKLSGNGICAILTSAAGGTPTPCTLKMAQGWITGIEIQKKINGVPILNEDAEMPCTNPACAGTMISVQKPLSPIVSFVLPSISIAGEVNDSKVSTNNSVSENNKSTNETENTTKSETQESDKEKKSENDSSDEKKCICSYDSCDKISSCPYMKASSTISTSGAAAKLRRNSPTKEKSYNELAEIRMNNNKISWNNQAHHIISVNAAYCQYPELVKLGNYFGYDINCEENCYFLPCWNTEDGYGKKDSHFKKAQAYEVMKASGLQWHVGQHSYRIELSASIMEKYPQLKGCDCYNDKLNKDIKEILLECNQRFESICPEDDYANHKEWFFRKMNDLSNKIEEYLDLFGGNPKDSFPYFVSLEALKYAYQIPRTGKVIYIYKTQTKWYLKRYEYTNYQKDNDFILNLLESKELAIANSRRDETIKSLVLFCQNVTCFLVKDDTKEYSLPFSYKTHIQYITDDEEEKIKSHFSAMLAEYADSEENEYTAPKIMAKIRLKECDLI